VTASHTPPIEKQGEMPLPVLSHILSWQIMKWDRECQRLLNTHDT